MDNFNSLDHTIQHLIITYLEGSCSDREIVKLQHWMSLSEENLVLFKRFREAWLLAGKTERYPLEDAWKKFDVRLERRLKSRRRNLRIRWMGYAAAIGVLLSVGYYYWGDLFSVMPEKGIGTEEYIVPGSKKAVLVLGSNARIALDQVREDSVLNRQTNIRKEGNTLVYEKSCGGDATEDNCLITPRGGEYAVILSDGTRVWLNAESELKYPVQFSENERKVYLKGEAYFIVTKQEGVPFIVCAGNTEVTVWGTEFNVRNYADGKIAATLVKGCVVVGCGQEMCRLEPGQQAVVNIHGIQVREVETVLYTAWKEGYFIFRDQPLEGILKELARWYDFTYFYQNKKLENCQLTAKLRKFDRVEKVLEVLKGVGTFKFIIKGKTVTVVSE